MSKAATAPSLSLADVLFTGTQQRVLALLFGQPTRSFYASELIGLAGMGSGAVQRELAKLAGSGLVTVRTIGNQKHYQANPEAPIFDELKGIVDKTFGLAEPLQAEFDLSPQELGTFAGAVHFALGAMQLYVGSGIDLHGVRRTVLTGSAGGCRSRAVGPGAPSYGSPGAGQMLIGVGCAPAFLACTVFIARHFAPAGLPRYRAR